MLWTIAVILVVMWLLGMVSSYTLGGFLHLLLVLAIIAVLINIIRAAAPSDVERRPEPHSAGGDREGV